jgi:hypothetical protein
MGGVCGHSSEAPAVAMRLRSTVAGQVRRAPGERIIAAEALGGCPRAGGWGEAEVLPTASFGDSSAERRQCLSRSMRLLTSPAAGRRLPAALSRPPTVLRSSRGASTRQTSPDPAVDGPPSSVFGRRTPCSRLGPAQAPAGSASFEPRPGPSAPSRSRSASEPTRQPWRSLPEGNQSGAAEVT